MCLAIPAKVVQKLDNDQAVVEVGGVRNNISLMLVDGVEVGDYVIVHVDSPSRGWTLKRPRNRWPFSKT